MKTKALVGTSDEQLIQEYLRGNNNSLGILYNRYYPKVYQKCLSFVKIPDDAFDLAQDVLMRVFSNISSFKGNSSFSTWLYAVTNNYCITSTSKKKRIKYEDIETTRNIIDNNVDDEELDARKHKEELELQLNTILADLPELDKELLELKYHNKYSIKDLQACYNLSASAVKMRLMRARQKVEQYYLLNNKLVS